MSGFLHAAISGWQSNLLWWAIGLVPVTGLVSLLIFGKKTPPPVPVPVPVTVTGDGNAVGDGAISGDGSGNTTTYDFRRNEDNRIIIDNHAITTVHKTVNNNNNSSGSGAPEEEIPIWVKIAGLLALFIAVAALFLRYFRPIAAIFLLITVVAATFAAVALITVRRRAFLTGRLAFYQVGTIVVAGIGVRLMFLALHPKHAPHGYQELIAATRTGNVFNCIGAAFSSLSDPAGGTGTTFFVIFQMVGAVILGGLLLQMILGTLSMLATVATATQATASWLWVFIRTRLPGLTPASTFYISVVMLIFSGLLVNGTVPWLLFTKANLGGGDSGWFDQALSFESPSGNIVCLLQGKTAAMASGRCKITATTTPSTITNAPPPPPPCTAVVVSSTYRVDAAGAIHECTDVVLGHSLTTLAVGGQLSLGPVTCSMLATGVHCASGAHGFDLGETAVSLF